jgi:hypothetical protein
MWWFTPIILATQEAEEVGSQVQGYPGLHSEALSQKNKQTDKQNATT